MWPVGSAGGGRGCGPSFGGRRRPDHAVGGLAAGLITFSERLPALSWL